MLSGRLTAKVGDDVIDAGPGELVVKPRGIPHAFWNTGAEPVRFLELICPGGFEEYFFELAAPFNARDEQAMGAVRDRYRLDIRPETIPSFLNGTAAAPVLAASLALLCATRASALSPVASAHSCVPGVAVRVAEPYADSVRPSSTTSGGIGAPPKWDLAEAQPISVPPLVLVVQSGTSVAGYYVFSSAAERTRALKASSSMPSPSWRSTARLTLPSRLELKRPAGSSREAPLAKVSFTLSS